jgi:septum formation protein
MPQLVLASTSPARKKILTDAGIRFAILHPGVNEEELVAVERPATTEAMVQLLAEAKAAAGFQLWRELESAEDAIVLGCDSALELAGESYGKPLIPELARQRWSQLSGAEGWLMTGHSLISVRTGERVNRVTKTLVRFQEVSESEISAYVATGEPLQVAGGFTIDGLGGAFIREIVGDYHTVVGLSLTALRDLSSELGISYHTLWDMPPVRQ